MEEVRKAGKKEGGRDRERQTIICWNEQLATDDNQSHQSESQIVRA